jgi:hypothetical protein
MYPSPDQLHLWWLTPIILILVVISLHFSINEFWGKSWRSLVGIIGILMLLLIFQIQLNQNSPRYHFKNSALSGMSGASLEAQKLDKTLDLMEITAKQGQIDIACEDGIYSSAGRKYLATSEYFLDIKSQVSLDNWNGKFLFFCNLDKNEFDFIRTQVGIEIVFAVRGSSTWNVVVSRRGI